jgi:hypothetical protein
MDRLQSHLCDSGDVSNDFANARGGLYDGRYGEILAVLARGRREGWDDMNPAVSGSHSLALCAFFINSGLRRSANREAGKQD